MPFEKGKSYYRLKKIKWEIDKNGCWICTSHAQGTGGYPKHKVNYKSKRISRTMYERYKGKIPDGMIICHRCDNPACINPKHLFAGTQKDNMKDMCKKGRKFITYGERNGMNKLTEKQVIAIKSLKDSGISQKEIAKIFNTSRSNIGFIISGKRWRYLA